MMSCRFDFFRVLHREKLAARHGFEPYFRCFAGALMIAFLCKKSARTVTMILLVNQYIFERERAKNLCSKEQSCSKCAAAGICAVFVQRLSHWMPSKKSINAV